MGKSKNCGLEFVMDCNVHIEVTDAQKVIRQQVDVHNKATKKLIDGLLKFIRGEFNQTFRRYKDVDIAYPGEARKYIPCYINIGTGGIRLIETKPFESSGDNTKYWVPDVDPANPRKPPLNSYWNEASNYVRFTDVKLELEETKVSRYEIGVVGFDETSDAIPAIGDMEQIIFNTEVPPGWYNSIYISNEYPIDIFVTELGLFASNVPGTNDLLARVILKDDSVLYVRPQDTIIIKWTISIISLNDSSYIDEDINTADISLKSGTAVNDKIPYSGTITNSTRKTTSR